MSEDNRKIPGMFLKNIRKYSKKYGFFIKLKSP